MSAKNEDSYFLYKKMQRIFLEYEMGNLYRYLDTLEQTLNTMQQDVSSNMEDMSNNELATLNQDDEYRKELINFKMEVERLRGFSNLLRQSFLISLYSFMELWLLRECHLDSKRRDSGKSYKSMRSKGLEKAKRYFSKVIQSEYPFSASQDWLWITNFRLLRDCIVHRRGNLSGLSDFEIDSTLFAFVQKERGLSLSGTNNQQIFIEYEFCLKSLKTVHKLMSEILELEAERSTKGIAD